ncbi:U-box domain-containing protein 62 isoform X2 [Impatiens glandulifera]|uniref:U-box domain-containing protein 62 isoform X2 n=1 Tax=Impatiens glandulifera TaxID=253017 RepID=UPI001FB118F4|nr:U-box domain-containing protein 62 isoform X2 [Impatiens glandulifera]
MTSDEMGLVFQNEGFRFNPPPRGGGGVVSVADPGPKTRELSVFTGDHHRFFRPQEAAELRHTMYVDDRPEIHRQQDWNVNGSLPGSTRRIDGSEDEEDEEEEDCDEDDQDVVGRDGNVKAIDGAGERNNGSNITTERSTNTDITIVNVGSNREFFGKYDNVMLLGNGNDNSNSRGSNPSESNHSLGAEGSGSRKKQLTEDGCGFSGSRDYSEFLRRIFSDPLTGEIMNDGVILPCGHSFGGGGIQHVLRMKACYTCSRPISEEAVTPNLSLRAAVQAFLREEELQIHRPSKRRRGERFEQDRGVHPIDSLSMDQPRGRGVQFPFSVMDRVIIQGNKRTPQRFVGRKAIVTAQCLNGWYVVKTLDNAESVKLQYRSLAKAPDDHQSSSLGQVPNKMAPNWLFSSSKEPARYTN